MDRWETINEDLGKAVAVSMAHQLSNDSKDTGEVLTAYLEDGVRVTDILAGYISLTGMLLAKIESETGQRADQVLQDMVKRAR